MGGKVARGRKKSNRRCKEKTDGAKRKPTNANRGELVDSYLCGSSSSDQSIRSIRASTHDRDDTIDVGLADESFKLFFLPDLLLATRPLRIRPDDFWLRKSIGADGGVHCSLGPISR